MFGKRIKKLEAIVTRLEAVTARLEHQEAMAAYASPAVRDAVICAANATLNHVLVDCRGAIVAGERDQAALLRAASAPLIRALGAVPEAQMASATLAATTCLISRLIDHLLEAAPMLPAFQTLAENFRDGGRSA